VAQAARVTAETFQALGGLAKHEATRPAGMALEAAGEPGRAAEVYALGGDQAEARRLGVPGRAPPPRGAAASSFLADLDALDRCGQRLAILGAVRTFMAQHTDAEVAAYARGVLARLLRGPIVTLALDGREQRIALGDSITIGRSGATIPVSSPLVSRLHLRLYRDGGTAFVEDAGTHNGTWLAGARIVAPLPVGDGLDLSIAREIPCSIRPAAGALAIEVAGERTLAPLGPLVVGGLRIWLASGAEGALVTLRPEPDVPTSLGDVPVQTAIELTPGDVVRASGEARVEVRVIG
jgi:hypothetical protein